MSKPNLIVERPAIESDLVGKTIARILQSEWEGDDYLACKFYIELSDAMLIDLGFGSLDVIEGSSGEGLELHDVATYGKTSAFYQSDENTGIGSSIQRVLKTKYGDVYLVLSGQYYLTPETCNEDCQDHLCLYDHNEFLHYAQSIEMFDYWTEKPYLVDNLRPIDVIVKTDIDYLWRNGELFLTIGRVKDGEVSNRMTIVNEAYDDHWKARFIVPEPGTYRIIAAKSQHEVAFTDIRIDESVIREGSMEVQIL